MRQETRAYTVMVPEQHTRTETYYVSIPQQYPVTQNFTVMVPEQHTRTETYYVSIPQQYAVNQTYTVMIPEQQSRTEYYSVCIPQTHSHEVTYQVQIPYTETLTATRKVCKMVPSCETRCYTVDEGHWEEACVESTCDSCSVSSCYVAPSCGCGSSDACADSCSVGGKKCGLLGFLKKPMGGNFLNFGRGRGIVTSDVVADDSYVIADSVATAPSTTTSIRRYWVPNIVQKQYSVTVMKSEMYDEPYTYNVTRYRSENRSRTVQSVSYNYEMRSREVPYTTYRPEIRNRQVWATTYVQEPRTREVPYTTMRPEVRTRTVYMTNWRQEPRTREVPYTTMRPEVRPKLSVFHTPSLSTRLASCLIPLCDLRLERLR